MTAPSALALLLTVTACGGHVDRELAGTKQGGAESSGSSGACAASEPHGHPEGGAGSDELEPGDPTVTGAGGGAGATFDLNAPIGSGTRNCEDERYCFGLECYAPTHLEQHVCVAGCERDADCSELEVCLQSDDLSPGCYRVCESVSDCSYGFDCFDFAGQREMLVCFPTEWAGVWERQRR